MNDLAASSAVWDLRKVSIGCTELVLSYMTHSYEEAMKAADRTQSIDGRVILLTALMQAPSENSLKSCWELLTCRFSQVAH